ncbi:hypothetical protein [Sphingomonas sp. MA1305]|uniref:hypothetical protein n=1 Tax=Sphingomonas sp. MA1305 TaxID=2479204 RepID=UPI0018DF1276|nr:hypothetical protein [Sphingomonas sp. MA1305]
MSDCMPKTSSTGVPPQTPMDLPMPEYRFQRDTSASLARMTDNAVARQAAEILREANLLGCTASNAGRRY